MKTFPERLEWAMARVGLSQPKLAKAAGVSQPTISNYFKREAGGSEYTAMLADALGVSALWLASGRGPIYPPGDAPPVQLVGYVGAGAEVFSVDDHAKGGGMDDVPPPPGFEGSCVAVRVRGDSMYPLLDDGWVLYYARTQAGVPETAVGRLCVVQVADDGPCLVKRVGRGSRRGLWRLESLNAPPREDVKLDWGSPVIAMVRL